MNVRAWLAKVFHRHTWLHVSYSDAVTQYAGGHRIRPMRTYRCATCCAEETKRRTETSYFPTPHTSYMGDRWHLGAAETCFKCEYSEDK